MNEVKASGTKEMPFSLPENAFADDQTIQHLFVSALKVKARVKAAEMVLKEQKAEFAAIEEQLVSQIEATGGEKWGGPQGTAWINAKTRYSFTKPNREAALQFVEEHGRDDLHTVNASAFSSFVNQLIDEAEAKGEEIQPPEWVSSYESKKIGLRAKGDVAL